MRTKVESRNAPKQSNLYDLEASGKLVALRELLRDAGIYVQHLTAADNDSSLLYCDGEEEQGSDVDDDQKVLEPDYQGSNNNDRQYLSNMNGSRCLIFAQFTHKLPRSFSPTPTEMVLMGKKEMSQNACSASHRRSYDSCKPARGPLSPVSF